MKKLFVVGGLCLLALLVVSADVLAQVPQSPLLPTLRVPRISQGAKVTQVVGLSEVTIFYHRPGVKGREIWGKLLPYGEVWRAGANEPTLFTFSDEVTIGGKKLAAGTYRFVVIPAQGDWTAIFNSEVKNWGTIYDAKYDTLRFAVTPEAGPHEEWMSFSFTDLTPNSARVVLAWEKVRIGFKIEFNTLARLQASVGTWQLLNSASRFALDNNMYFAEAMSWIDRALAIEKNANTLRTKAELLAKAGKKGEAITTGEEALKAFKAMDQSRMSQFQKDQFTAFEKLVADWKSKM
jgi:hypothetical protein